jgi:hypothetical protein
MTTRLTPDDAGRETSGTAVENLAELDATSTLLDAVAARRTTEADPLAAALIAWLDEIDTEYRPVYPDVLAAFATVPTPRQSHRRRHLIMLAAAVTISVAAGTGVAAASPGSLFFPVHRALFGPAAPLNDPLEQGSELLDQVQTAITSAHGQPLTTTQVATATLQLGQAIDVLISASPSSRRTALIARHDLLTGELTALDRHEAAPAGSSAALAFPSTAPSPLGQATKAKPVESGQQNNGEENSKTTGSSAGTGDAGVTSGDTSGIIDSPDLPVNTPDPAASDNSGSSGLDGVLGGGSGSGGGSGDGGSGDGGTGLDAGSGDGGSGDGGTGLDAGLVAGS